jgi:tripartite-type tricarboxylate transporter receptor subunit TctC
VAGTRMRCVLLAILLIAALSPSGSAQDFPSRLVRIVVPFPPGSGTDILARLLADQLSRKWKNPVIVENLAGTASGNVAAAEFARAAPDGHTLMLCPPGPIVTNRLLYKNLSYDPDKWVPISLLATVPYVLMARKNLEAKTIQELIATAKANPKTVTVASAGPGSSGTLATSNFEMMAGIELNAIPYRGLGPAIKDVVAGQVDLMFDTITTSLPLFLAGNVKILGTGTEKRLSVIPEVPTIAESGLPGFRSITWFGLIAPPGTSAALADQINRDVTDIINDRQVFERITSMNMQAVASTREEASKFFAEESLYWGKVVKDANITLD